MPSSPIWVPGSSFTTRKTLEGFTCYQLRRYKEVSSSQTDTATSY